MWEETKELNAKDNERNKKAEYRGVHMQVSDVFYRENSTKGSAQCL